MRSLDTKEEAYDWCTTEGSFLIEKEIERDRIISNITVAEECFEQGNDGVKKKLWNSTYILHYTALHLLVESFLLLENMKSRNHLCLFAYLCVKHPELELDWGFFEKARTKRNGIHYYGTPIGEREWKEVCLQFQLYIKLLQKKLKERLKVGEKEG